MSIVANSFSNYVSPDNYKFYSHRNELIASKHHDHDAFPDEQNPDIWVGFSEMKPMLIPKIILFEDLANDLDFHSEKLDKTFKTEIQDRINNSPLFTNTGYPELQNILNQSISLYDIRRQLYQVFNKNPNKYDKELKDAAIGLVNNMIVMEDLIYVDTVKELVNRWGLLNIVREHDLVWDKYNGPFYHEHKNIKSEEDDRQLWYMSTERLFDYKENIFLWIDLLVTYDFIVRKKHHRDLSNMSERIDSFLKDTYPKIEFENDDIKHPKMEIASKTLGGAFVLYLLDNLQTRIGRCVECGKFFIGGRSDRKFCITNGPCSKKYQKKQKIEEQAKRVGR